MSRSAWVWIVVIIVVLVGGYFLLDNQGTSSVTPQDTSVDTSSQAAPTPTASSDQNAATAPMAASVTYDGNSFSPSTVTVARGGTVTFTDTSGTMWVASNPHPVHTGYDGTSRSEHCARGYQGAAPFDQCTRGSTYRFTFDKVGTWDYHDHVNDSAEGVVIVQ